LVSFFHMNLKAYHRVFDNNILTIPAPLSLSSASVYYKSFSEILMNIQLKPVGILPIPRLNLIIFLGALDSF